MPRLDVVPVGWVESPLVERTQAPRQGDEGAPPAWLVFEARTGEAIRDLRVDDEIIVITWLDRADRDVLSTRPRDEPDRPVVGVFSTRSPDRPNPIGLHDTTVVSIGHRSTLLGYHDRRIDLKRGENGLSTPVDMMQPQPAE